MPLRLPRCDDRSSLPPRLAAGAVAACLALLAVSPVAAATLLLNATATPGTGTTDTTFVLSVDYVSDPEGRRANTVTVEIVGLGGEPLPMSLVAGDDTNGTWQTSTMLPAGTWDLVFRADASGSDPDPAVGIVVVVTTAPTPTPTASAGASQSPPPPTSTPSALPTATASPDATAAPTPVPTPLPPGVTPTPRPAPTAPAPPSPEASSPDSSERAGASSSARPRDGATPRPASSADPASTAPASRSSVASPSPAPADGEVEPAGTGWGQAGLIVLGGLTSAAGAAVLARQWIARRAGRRP